MQVETSMENENEMVVKRLSVPLGLEELMESLTKEVLRKRPADVYAFASEHFAQLLTLRDTGCYKNSFVKKKASVENLEGMKPPPIKLKGAMLGMNTKIPISAKSTLGNNRKNDQDSSPRNKSLDSPGIRSDRAKQILDKHMAKKQNSVDNSKVEPKGKVVRKYGGKKGTPQKDVDARKSAKQFKALQVGKEAKNDKVSGKLPASLAASESLKGSDIEAPSEKEILRGEEKEIPKESDAEILSGNEIETSKESETSRGDESAIPKGSEAQTLSVGTPQAKEIEFTRDGEDEIQKRNESETSKSKETEISETEIQRRSEVQIPGGNENETPKVEESGTQRGNENESSKEEETETLKSNENEIPKESEAQTLSSNEIETPEANEVESVRGDVNEIQKENATQIPEGNEGRTSTEKGEFDGITEKETESAASEELKAKFDRNVKLSQDVKQDLKLGSKELSEDKTENGDEQQSKSEEIDEVVEKKNNGEELEKGQVLFKAETGDKEEPSSTKSESESQEMLPSNSSDLKLADGSKANTNEATDTEDGLKSDQRQLENEENAASATTETKTDTAEAFLDKKLESEGVEEKTKETTTKVEGNLKLSGEEAPENEKRNVEKLENAAVTIQASWRGYHARKRLHEETESKPKELLVSGTEEVEDFQVSGNKRLQEETKSKLKNLEVTSEEKDVKKLEVECNKRLQEETEAKPKDHVVANEEKSVENHQGDVDKNLQEEAELKPKDQAFADDEKSVQNHQGDVEKRLQEEAVPKPKDQVIVFDEKASQDLQVNDDKKLQEETEPKPKDFAITVEEKDIQDIQVNGDGQDKRNKEPGSLVRQETVTLSKTVAQTDLGPKISNDSEEKVRSSDENEAKKKGAENKSSKEESGAQLKEEDVNLSKEVAEPIKRNESLAKGKTEEEQSAVVQESQSKETPEDLLAKSTNAAVKIQAYVRGHLSRQKSIYRNNSEASLTKSGNNDENNNDEKKLPHKAGDLNKIDPETSESFRKTFVETVSERDHDEAHPVNESFERGKAKELTKAGKITRLKKVEGLQGSKSEGEENLNVLELSRIEKASKSPLFGDSVKVDSPAVEKLAVASNNAESAAVKIQSLWRGHRIRRDAKNLELKNLQKPTACDELAVDRSSVEDLIKAATIIQALFRGYSVRKHFGMEKMGTTFRKEKPFEEKLATVPEVEDEDGPERKTIANLGDLTLNEEESEEKQRGNPTVLEVNSEDGTKRKTVANLEGSSSSKEESREKQGKEFNPTFPEVGNEDGPERKTNLEDLNSNEEELKEDGGEETSQTVPEVEGKASNEDNPKINTVSNLEGSTLNREESKKNSKEEPNSTLPEVEEDVDNEAISKIEAIANLEGLISAKEARAKKLSDEEILTALEGVPVPPRTPEIPRRSSSRALRRSATETETKLVPPLKKNLSVSDLHTRNAGEKLQVKEEDSSLKPEECASDIHEDIAEIANSIKEDVVKLKQVLGDGEIPNHEEDDVFVEKTHLLELAGSMKEDAQKLRETLAKVEEGQSVNEVEKKVVTSEDFENSSNEDSQTEEKLEMSEPSNKESTTKAEDDQTTEEKAKKKVINEDSTLLKRSIGKNDQITEEKAEKTTTSEDFAVLNRPITKESIAMAEDDKATEGKVEEATANEDLEVLNSATPAEKHKSTNKAEDFDPLSKPIDTTTKVNQTPEANSEKTMTNEDLELVSKDPTTPLEDDQSASKPEDLELLSRPVSKESTTSADSVDTVIFNDQKPRKKPIRADTLLPENYIQDNLETSMQNLSLDQFDDISSGSTEDKQVNPVEDEVFSEKAHQEEVPVKHEVKFRVLGELREDSGENDQNSSGERRLDEVKEQSSDLVTDVIDTAAKKIQKFFRQNRGKSRRKSASTVDRTAEILKQTDSMQTQSSSEDDKNAAATTIQKTYRGYRVRRGLKKRAEDDAEFTRKEKDIDREITNLLKSITEPVRRAFSAEEKEKVEEDGSKEEPSYVYIPLKDYGEDSRELVVPSKSRAGSRVDIYMPHFAASEDPDGDASTSDSRTQSHSEGSSISRNLTTDGYSAEEISDASGKSIENKLEFEQKEVERVKSEDVSEKSKDRSLELGDCKSESGSERSDDKQRSREEERVDLEDVQSVAEAQQEMKEETKELKDKNRLQRDEETQKSKEEETYDNENIAKGLKTETQQETNEEAKELKDTNQLERDEEVQKSKEKEAKAKEKITKGLKNKNQLEKTEATKEEKSEEQKQTNEKIANAAITQYINSLIEPIRQAFSADKSKDERKREKDEGPSVKDEGPIYIPLRDYSDESPTQEELGFRSDRRKRDLLKQESGQKITEDLKKSTSNDAPRVTEEAVHPEPSNALNLNDLEAQILNELGLTEGELPRKSGDDSEKDGEQDFVAPKSPVSLRTASEVEGQPKSIEVSSEKQTVAGKLNGVEKVSGKKDEIQSAAGFQSRTDENLARSASGEAKEETCFPDSPPIEDDFKERKLKENSIGMVKEQKKEEDSLEGKKDAGVIAIGQSAEEKTEGVDIVEENVKPEEKENSSGMVNEKKKKEESEEMKAASMIAFIEEKTEGVDGKRVDLDEESLKLKENSSEVVKVEEKETHEDSKKENDVAGVVRVVQNDEAQGDGGPKTAKTSDLSSTQQNEDVVDTNDKNNIATDENQGGEQLKRSPEANLPISNRIEAANVKQNLEETVFEGKDSEISKETLAKLENQVIPAADVKSGGKSEDNEENGESEEIKEEKREKHFEETVKNDATEVEKSSSKPDDDLASSANEAKSVSGVEDEAKKEDNKNKTKLDNKEGATDERGNLEVDSALTSGGREEKKIKVTGSSYEEETQKACEIKNEESKAVTRETVEDVQGNKRVSPIQKEDRQSTIEETCKKSVATPLGEESEKEKSSSLDEGTQDRQKKDEQSKLEETSVATSFAEDEQSQKSSSLTEDKEITRPTQEEDQRGKSETLEEEREEGKSLDITAEVDEERKDLKGESETSDLTLGKGNGIKESHVRSIEEEKEDLHQEKRQELQSMKADTLLNDKEFGYEDSDDQLPSDSKKMQSVDEETSAKSTIIRKDIDAKERNERLKGEGLQLRNAANETEVTRDDLAEKEDKIEEDVNQKSVTENLAQVQTLLQSPQAIEEAKKADVNKTKVESLDESVKVEDRTDGTEELKIEPDLTKKEHNQEENENKQEVEENAEAGLQNHDATKEAQNTDQNKAEVDIAASGVKLGKNEGDLGEAANGKLRAEEGDASLNLTGAVISEEENKSVAPTGSVGADELLTEKKVEERLVSQIGERLEISSKKEEVTEEGNPGNKFNATEEEDKKLGDLETTSKTAENEANIKARKEESVSSLSDATWTESKLNGLADQRGIEEGKGIKENASQQVIAEGVVKETKPSSDSETTRDAKEADVKKDEKKSGGIDTEIKARAEDAPSLKDESATELQGSQENTPESSKESKEDEWSEENGDKITQSNTDASLPKETLQANKVSGTAEEITEGSLDASIQNPESESSSKDKNLPKDSERSATESKGEDECPTGKAGDKQQGERRESLPKETTQMTGSLTNAKEEEIGEIYKRESPPKDKDSEEDTTGKADSTKSKENDDCPKEKIEKEDELKGKSTEDIRSSTTAEEESEDVAAVDSLDAGVKLDNPIQTTNASKPESLKSSDFGPESILEVESKSAPFYLHQDSYRKSPTASQEKAFAEALKNASGDLGKAPAEEVEGLLHSSEFHDSIPLKVTSEKTTTQATAPSRPQLLAHSGELHDNIIPLVLQMNDAPAGAEAVTSGREVSAAQASDKDVSAKREDAPDATQRSQASSSGMDAEKRNNSAIVRKSTEVEAATKIQASFRGYQVRKQLKSRNTGGVISSNRRSSRRKSSGRISDSKRAALQSKSPSQLEQESATKIQAGIRGFLVRRRQKKEKKISKMPESG